MKWRLIVNLDNIDVSERLTGQVRIEAEESTARIAEFSLLPFAGPISLTGYVGKRITIDYLQIEPQGPIQRLFTGVVDVPEYFPSTKVTTFQCTDSFQTKAHYLVFGSKTFFSTITGAIYSEPIFGQKHLRSGWHVIQDAMTTLPASYDLDVQGNPVFAPWASKPAEDFLFTESDIINKSLSVQYARRSNLKNTVTVEYQYRYERLHQQNVLYKWAHPSICFSTTNGMGIPTKKMITDAIASSGWNQLNIYEKNAQGLPTIPVPLISFTEPPASGHYTCGDRDTIFEVSDSVRPLLAFGFETYLTKRYAKNVTDNYTIKVQSSASQTNIGVINSKLSGSLQSGFNADDWASDQRKLPHILPEALNFIGEAVFDQTTIHTESREDSDKALKCLIQQAKTQILASHRQNIVTFSIPVAPELDRVHTVKVDTEYIKAMGKVKHFTHTLDTTTGSAITLVNLAISRVDALGIQDDTTDPVFITPPPASPPLARPKPAYLFNLALRNTLKDSGLLFFNSNPGTPADIDYIGNTVTNTTTGYISDTTGNNHEFRIPTLAISDADVAATNNIIRHTADIVIPDELLIVSA